MPVIASVHRPGANTPQADVTRLRSVIVERVQPTITAQRPAPVVPVPPRRRVVWRGGQVRGIVVMAARARAAVRRVLLPGTPHGLVQAQLLLLVVPARPVVVCLVADPRVPGLVRVERPEPAAPAPAARGAPFVCARGGPAVALLDLADLVVEPADDAAWRRGWRTVGAGFRFVEEGYEGGDGGWRKLFGWEGSVQLALPGCDLRITALRK